MRINMHAIIIFVAVLLLSFSVSQAEQNKTDSAIYRCTELIKANNYFDALNCLSELIAVDSSNLQALLSLGNVFNKIDSYQVAILVFEKLLSIDSLSAEGHFGLGETYLYLEKPISAMEEFNKAVKIDSNLVEAHALLGIGSYNASIAPGPIDYRRYTRKDAIKHLKKYKNLGGISSFH